MGAVLQWLSVVSTLGSIVVWPIRKLLHWWRLRKDNRYQRRLQKVLRKMVRRTLKALRRVSDDEKD